MSVHSSSDENLIKLKSTLAEVQKTSSLILSYNYKPKLKDAFSQRELSPIFKFSKRRFPSNWPRLKLFLGVSRSFSLTITKSHSSNIPPFSCNLLEVFAL